MVCALLQLAKTPAVPCHSPQRARTRRQSLVDRLSKAFVGQSIAESDPMYGNVWVYVADEKGRRCVLLQSVSANTGTSAASLIG